MKVKVRHGVLVQRSPQDVFAFVSEPDNMPQWQSTLFEVTEKKQTKKDAHQKDKLQAKARVRDRRNVLGKDIDSEYEVIDYAQDQRLALKVVDGPVSFQMKWEFEPLDGGTWFSAEGEGDLGDLRMSAAAANRSAQHLLENDLATLRDLLEHNHA